MGLEHIQHRHQSGPTIRGESGIPAHQPPTWHRFHLPSCRLPYTSHSPLDANKLPGARPPLKSFYDVSTAEGQKEYLDALEKWENMSPITGIFKSFSDAPAEPPKSSRR